MNKYACACIQWYTYVSIWRCCAICREFASHSPTAFIYWEFLECAVSVSWSQSRGHGCTVFFSFFLCSHARLCEHRDMHMRVMHITCRLHTSSPLRNVLCVYSVCVFNACMPIRAQIRNYWGRIRNFVMRSEICNNYEFFVMVGSSVCVDPRGVGGGGGGIDTIASNIWTPGIKLIIYTYFDIIQVLQTQNLNPYVHKCIFLNVHAVS